MKLKCIDVSHLNKVQKELDIIFYSVPQPCMLEKKWETKKKEQKQRFL